MSAGGNLSIGGVLILLVALVRYGPRSCGLAERARQRPRDTVQLVDSEHRALGWGLRVGEDPMGNP